MSPAFPVHRTDVPAAHRRRVVIGLAAAPLAMSLGDALAQGGADITLPPAQTEGGMPLMQALNARRTSRSFAPQALPPQMLSDLLWAAFGVNRPDGRAHRPIRAQPAGDRHLRGDGRPAAWVYDREGACAAPVEPKDDVRVGARARRAYARVGAVDAGLRRRHSPHDRPRASRRGSRSRRGDAGFIAQNVYLFCASERPGHGGVRRRSHRERLATALGARPRAAHRAGAVGRPSGALSDPEGTPWMRSR